MTPGSQSPKVKRTAELRAFPPILRGLVSKGPQPEGELKKKKKKGLEGHKAINAVKCRGLRKGTGAGLREEMEANTLP